MKKKIYTLYKASGAEGTTTGTGEGSSVDLSPYSFGTLWKEITKAISSGFQSLTDISTKRLEESGATARYYWLHARDGEDSRDNNYGFYILLALVLIVGLVIFIVKNKKSK